MTLDPVAHFACKTGEGPLWHPDDNAVYWFDIPMGRLFRYDCAKGRAELIHTGEVIGAATLEVDGNLLLLGAGCAIDRFDLQTRTRTRLIGPIADESRFNDAIVDRGGRIYSGSMVRGDWNTGEPGRLYRIDPDGTRTVIDEGFRCPNGFAFTPDGSELTFTNTTEGQLLRYRHDPDTGALTDRRVVWADPDQTPDGIAADTTGHLWSARWGGHAVICHDWQTGEPIDRIAVPAEAVTSLCFAGPDLDEIYVTSAMGKGVFDPPPDDLAGALFHGVIERDGTRVRGVPEFRSRLG